jgi:hypothetical protein
MSPHVHDHGTATVGRDLWMMFLSTCDAVSWRYGANGGLWRDF